MNVDITKAEYRAGKDGKGFFEFVFETAEHDNAPKIARTLRTVAGVSEVEILPAKKDRR